jgi:triacylglycerol lipase
MGGFSQIAGIDYFYGIGYELTQNGAQVFQTQVASFDSSYVRGEQLLQQTKQILAITGAPKVNLIGHSQGTLDVRYVAGMLPDKIASVTTVGGLNKGVPIADAVLTSQDSPAGTIILPVVKAAVDAFFTLVGIGSGQKYDQSSQAGVDQISTAGMEKFNAMFPAGLPTTACGEGASVVNGQRFYSWGGTGKLTNLLDPSAVILTATGLIGPKEGDGLVPKCTSHIGKVIRDDYNQNHFDQVNQVLGMVSLFETNPVSLFRQHANRLKQAGL